MPLLPSASEVSICPLRKWNCSEVPLRELWALQALALPLVLCGSLMPAELFAQNATILINEFMAVNESCCTDDFGEADDWVELYNYGEMSVDVGGMYVTDDLDRPTTWRIPSTDTPRTTIEAGGYLAGSTANPSRALFTSMSSWMVKERSWVCSPPPAPPPSTPSVSARSASMSRTAGGRTAGVTGSSSPSQRPEPRMAPRMGPEVCWHPFRRLSSPRQGGSTTAPWR